MAHLTPGQKTQAQAFLTDLDTRRNSLQTLLKALTVAEASPAFIVEGMNVERSTMQLIKDLEAFIRRDDDLI